MRKLAITAVLCTVSFLQAAGAWAEGTKPQAAEYIGSETCLGCHDGMAVSGPHAAKTDPRSPAAKENCESCHGAGSKHADAVQSGSGDLGGILQFGAKSALSAEEKNASCLQCHKGGHLTQWQGSTHETRGVSCGACHSLHKKNRDYLKEPVQSDICAECHKDVRADLQKTSHHPIREGKMQCSDCHNVHGTVTEQLISADSINTKCYECHAEKRGPFLWEHAPATENCSNCHKPHGSVHENLLTAKVPLLCQRCHSEARHPGTLYAQDPQQAGAPVYGSMNNRLFYRSCANCHSQVHGSNHPSGATLAR